MYFDFTVDTFNADFMRIMCVFLVQDVIRELCRMQERHAAFVIFISCTEYPEFGRLSQIKRCDVKLKFDIALVFSEFRTLDVFISVHEPRIVSAEQE